MPSVASLCRLWKSGEYTPVPALADCMPTDPAAQDHFVKTYFGKADLLNDMKEGILALQEAWDKVAIEKQNQKVFGRFELQGLTYEQFWLIANTVPLIIPKGLGAALRPPAAQKRSFLEDDKPVSVLGSTRSTEPFNPFNSPKPVKPPNIFERFGSAQENAPTNPVSILSSTQSEPTKPFSVFGGPPPPVPTSFSEMIRRTQPAEPTKSVSIFGSAQPTEPTKSFSVFGGPPPPGPTSFSEMIRRTQPAEPTKSVSIFGSAQPTEPTKSFSVFGGSRPTESTESVSVFGGSRPTEPTKSVSVFGGSRPTEPTKSFTIFDSAQLPESTKPTSLSEMLRIAGSIMSEMSRNDSGLPLPTSEASLSSKRDEEKVAKGKDAEIGKEQNKTKDSNSVPHIKKEEEEEEKDALAKIPLST